MSKTKSLKNYDPVAGIYDVMSSIYSLGKIRAAKLDQARFLNPGDKVLVAGCGTGDDVLEFAELGCRVTAVDTSDKMLGKLKAKLDRKSLSATLICDRFENLDEQSFDTVCSNFFLNLFQHEQMESVMRKLTNFVRSNGNLMIADVAPPNGSLIARTANRVYLHGAMLPFWMMGMVRWHANHDYETALQNLGWTVQAKTPFRLSRLGGPVVYQNLVASQNSDKA